MASWRTLPPSVVALGLVSFFTDLSSEMILPLLPAFLLGLGAGGTFIGLIEGVAETTSSLLKLGSGVVADRMPRKKPLVVAGYGLASVARPLVSIAAAPWHVLAIRFVDRIGKGIRSSPRDALIAEVAPADRRGEAFGFHRAMDHAGALAGPLFAYVLISAFHLEVRTVFALAAIPAGLSLVALIAGVKEQPRTPAAPGAEAAGAASPPAGSSSAGSPSAGSSSAGSSSGGSSSAGSSSAGPSSAGPASAESSARLPRSLAAYLALVGLFTLAGSSDAFLLLRAQSLGVPIEQAPLLWALLHVVKTVLATPLGALSDRVPRRRLIAAGWLVYALVYAGFAVAGGPLAIWALFVVYGAYFGLVEGAEKALVADLAPASMRGRAFGAFHLIVGLAALPASLVFGVVLDRLGAHVAFGGAAAIAAIASLALTALSLERS